jgi:hypothetical protein
MNGGTQGGSPQLYIIRVADTMKTEPADKFLICKQVATINSTFDAYAYLEDMFSPLPDSDSDSLVAIPWDIQADGIQLDGTIDP